MTPYIFGLAASLICACVVIAILAYKLLHKGIVVSGEGFEKGISAFSDNIAPVSKGLGKIAEAVAGRIETRQKELNHLRNEIAAMTSKIQHLESLHVSVDKIEPVLKLAFISVDFKMTDVVLEPVVTTAAGYIEQKQVIEYLGVFDACNTQRLGVDLNRLRFRRMSDAVIEVSGVGKTEVVGNINTSINPRFCEMRMHRSEGTIRSDSHEILQDDPKGHHLRRHKQQWHDVHALVTNPEPMKVINEAIEKMTLQFLKTYFASAEVAVVKAITEFQDGKTLAQICDDINSRVGQLVTAKRREAQQLEAALSAKDDQLREEVRREIIR